MADQTGPFVQIATFCRDVVEQADQGVTLVGVTNRATAEPDEDGTYAGVFTMFVSIRSGDLNGRHEIYLRPIAPNGDEIPPQGSFPTLFEGGASGLEIQVEFVMEVSEEGLYWFELSLDRETVLTRIPLEISFEASS